MSTYSKVKLEGIIESRKNRLKKYAMRENCSQTSIDIANQDIAELIDLYNSLGFGFRYFDLWDELDDKIQSLEQQDENINGHIIILRNSFGNNFSLIDFSIE